MMKRQSTIRRTRSTSRDTAPAVAVATLTARTQHLIDGVRKPFMDFTGELAAITVSRDELAPKFMHAFEAWKAETEGDFVSFARLFDATIPEDRKAYKKHKTYNAADYLRRLVALQARGKKKPLPASRRPATPFVALARLVQTVLPNIDPKGAVWQAFIHEMHWDAKMAGRVQKLGQKLGPVPVTSRTALRVLRTGTHD